MKKILSAFIALYLLVPAGHSQDDEIRPKALGISFFMNDFVSPQRIRSSSLVKVMADNNMAKMSEMSPGLAITYSKGMQKHIDYSVTVGGSFLRYPMPNRSFTYNRFLLEANAAVQLKMTTEKYWVQPYLTLGVGGHKYLHYYGAFLPLGVGMKVNLFDETHLFISSIYRVPVTPETANYHLQHSIGFAARLGKKKMPPPPPPVVLPPSDRDGDGIIDDLDKCPDVKGLAKYDGCPIPDTDKDGINDEEDKCPTVPGLARYQGCPIPDTDKDGINDEEDKCPTVPGLARYQGCPIPDTDGDGVNDEEDRCITIPGPKENYGCPMIPAEVSKRVSTAAKNILFITGSSKLQTSSFKGLNDVAKIMTENPGMSLAIDGHTDNVGSDEFNQKLSDNRAASVKDYLVSKGVDASRITATGHGETMPIADNKTAAGRKLNRRSELTLSYYK
ncbi:MAG: OmpA family protein [Chitinophagaceae bacterium]